MGEVCLESSLSRAGIISSIIHAAQTTPKSCFTIDFLSLFGYSSSRISEKLGIAALAREVRESKFLSP